MMFYPKSIIDLTHRAGQAIMGVYNSDFAVEAKNDTSLLTQADLASHQCIVQGLAQLAPSIPVLSEESLAQDIEDRIGWSLHWLIDPLDGTKEFVKRNGEFTVNIALIQNHQPIFGVVYAPALQTTWWSHQGHGAFKICPGSSQTPIQVRSRPDHITDWKVVGSRSHQTQEFEAFIQNQPGAQLVSMGSSIKLCLVAEGAADLYPRLGPTSEWDTAAAHAVVEAAGGQVLEYPGMHPLRYNTRLHTLLNPHFLVCDTPHDFSHSDTPN